MQLTAQQQNFFDTFGYLAFPGLFRPETARITQEFRAVFDDRGVAHDASKRTCMVPFIDQRVELSALIDDPRIQGIATGLLGDDYNYVISDGNYYTGDTSWHRDGHHSVNTYLKVAFYLDPVNRESGALRVIPGSHRVDLSHWQVQNAANAPQLWDIAQTDVPAVTLASVPGDVVVFNHNLMHASFGGDTQRRMFTVNFCRRAKTAPEVQDLKEFIAVHSRFWLDHMHGQIMRDTASDRRMRHLEQVMQLETDLPRLSAEARREMEEPSRS